MSKSITMQTITPSLSIRPISEEDIPFLMTLLQERLTSLPYTAEMTLEKTTQQLLSPNPPTAYSVRWQQHLRVVAWRAREMIGFLDAAVGLDQDSLDQPDYQPLGLLRFLILPTRAELIDDVATALLAEAESFWKSAGVGYIKAFHLSTGYPTFEMGAGILPGDWSEHVRILTGADYQLSERYYRLRRTLNEPIEERLPRAEVSLVYRRAQNHCHYQLYRQTDPIGDARVVTRAFRIKGQILRVAHLVHIEMDPQWRGQHIGKWLLLRMINDYTLQGYQEMIVHPAHSQHTAITLLNQLGFDELGYRGYSLEKALQE